MNTIQPSFASGELAPSLAGRVDIQKYNSGAKTLKNMFIHPHGGVSNRPGTIYIGNAAGKGRLIGFQFNVVQAYVLEFTHQKIRVLKDGGFVVYPAEHANAGQIVEIATPYIETDLPLMKYTQSADTMFIVHPSYPPKKLTRSDHHVWSLINMTFSTTLNGPTSLTATANNGLGGSLQVLKYLVTAVVAGEESPVSNEATMSITLPWPSGGNAAIAWNAVTNAEYYNVYKNKSGYYGWIGRASGTSFTDDNIDPDTSNSIPTSRTIFEAAGKYPGAVGIFEQRMVFGRSNQEPQTVWCSQSGNLNNFGVSTPLKDDDSITATIASRRVNEIQHFVPLKILFVLTAGTEWTMEHGSNSEALTPTSIQFKVQSERGSSHVPPLVIGDDLLYLQRGGTVVRDLFYRLDTDGYVGNNLSVLSSHLFKKNIIDWTYQQAPDSLVWCIRSDGKLLSLTYLKEHEVFAWSKHETDGVFESVCSIPNNENKDELYFIVNRTVNGQSVRYVEKLADRLPTEDIKDAFFVDSGLSYSGDVKRTFTGLEHLDGKAVAVLADGNVVPNITVANGSVTLPYASGKVHIGLPYESVLETLNMSLNQSAAFAQGQMKAITRITLRLDNTRGLFVGPDADHLVEAPFRTNEDYNEPTGFFTGDKVLGMDSFWSTEGRIMIKQVDPLPVTILAVIPDIILGR